jgi:mannonate dehydratase
MTASGTRRDFLMLPLALSGAAAVGSPSGKVIAEDDPSNIRLAHRVTTGISDDDLFFLKQIGLRWARAEFAPEASLDLIRQTKERFAGFGIGIASCAHYAFRAPNIELGRPGRDADIEHCRDIVRELGRNGIPVCVYDWHPENTYTTAMVERRGYKAREFSVEDFRSKIEKQVFGRDYSVEEMEANHTYFIKALLPAAERANVRLALHPDDPPVLETMNGVGRVFRNYEGYRRAELAFGGNPYWGIRLCVGTWAEGGDQMGKNLFEMIRDFGSRGRIYDVDFRNVTSPLPRFTETFPDDGCLDMYQVMKALRQVRYNGPLVPDHIPQLAGDTGTRRAGTAYCIAYIRSLLRRANEEVG